MVKYIIIAIIILAGFFLWPRSHEAKKQPTELAKGVENLYRSVNDPESSAKQESVINLYATSWCGYCAKARSLFKQYNIRYIEYDIEKDSSAKARYDKLGGRGVPLIEANGNVIKGYNEHALKQLIADERYKL